MISVDINILLLIVYLNPYDCALYGDNNGYSYGYGGGADGYSGGNAIEYVPQTVAKNDYDSGRDSGYGGEVYQYVRYLDDASGYANGKSQIDYEVAADGQSGRGAAIAYGGGGGGGGAYGGPISAAVKSSRTYEIRQLNVPYEAAKEQTIVVEASDTPITIHFKSASSQIKVSQSHYGSKGSQEYSKSEDEPHRLTHKVIKPIIQEVREIITPYRKIVQDIRPVVEEIQTIVSKGERKRALEQAYDVKGGAVDEANGYNGYNGGYDGYADDYKASTQSYNRDYGGIGNDGNGGGYGSGDGGDGKYGEEIYTLVRNLFGVSKGDGGAGYGGNVGYGGYSGFDGYGAANNKFYRS